MNWPKHLWFFICFMSQMSHAWIYVVQILKFSTKSAEMKYIWYWVLNQTEFILKPPVNSMSVEYLICYKNQGWVNNIRMDSKAISHAFVHTFMRIIRKNVFQVQQLSVVLSFELREGTFLRGGSQAQPWSGVSISPVSIHDTWAYSLVYVISWRNPAELFFLVEYF